ncbi:MAG: hypothetical protein WBL23_12095 [Salinisphaera sp.]|uniref:hypothetical protein n=1 Tax=Salinisphaera sp. TaxID=1914330 RepID=UPI003C7D3073
MFRTSLVAFGIVLASGGLALAQQSSSDAGPPNPPPKPAGHHPAPPPPGGPAALQGKGFDLQLGHGRGLRVQCGDEQLNSCIKAAQPLIHQLKQSKGRGERGISWKQRQKTMGQGSMGQGSMGQGSGMMKQGAGTNQGSSMNSGASQSQGQGMGQTPSASDDQSTQPDSSGGQTQ